jgi:hypothetical protein
VRLEHSAKELVFGPYYARAAALVPVSNDVVVVFGCEGTQLDESSDEALLAAASLAADAVGAVTPAKLLADELEELEAVRSAMAVPTESSFDDIAHTLGRIAAESLSCEVAALYVADGERVVIAERGWSLAAGQVEIAEALGGVLQQGRFPYCVQDASVVPLPPPLDREDGIRSYYLLELTGIARGVLFVAHTDAAPRGFTLLCRRLGIRLAAVVSAKLGLALTQEWCSAEAGRLHAEFGRLGPS